MNKKDFANHVISKLAQHGVDAKDDTTTGLAEAVAEGMTDQGNIDDLIQQLEQTQTPARAIQAIAIAQLLKKMYIRKTEQ